MTLEDALTIIKLAIDLIVDVFVVFVNLAYDGIRVSAGVIKDTATVIGIGIASYVAWVGLSTWRKQLTGTSEYELAREVLKAVYLLRDKIDNLRNPAINPSEMATINLDELRKDETYDWNYLLRRRSSDPVPKEKVATVKMVSDEELFIKARGEALRFRWPAVREALSEFELASIEAEILFDNEVKAKLDTVKRLLAILFPKSNSIIVICK